jgi:hypothetical protein
MAFQSGHTIVGPYLLRIQDGKLFAPNEVAGKIENMYPMEEGSLRSIWGPATYVPVKDDDEGRGGLRPKAAIAQVSSSHFVTSTLNSDEIDHTVPTYGRRHHGIYHCMLQGGTRDVLLLHTGTELWEFRGWQRNWRQILSNPAGGYGLQADLLDDTKSRFPTQFESTGNGVVIVPQEGRSYFYDGVAIAPLGFDQIPGSPLGFGPEDSKTDWGEDIDEYGDNGINDRGYAHDGLPYIKGFTIGSVTNADLAALNFSPGMTHGFGVCRIGTVRSLEAFDKTTLGTGGSSGWLDPGEWRAKVQFVDRWGNLSAMSAASNGVTFSHEPSLRKDMAGAVHAYSTAQLRKQVLWDGIPTGPDHCIGRILYRTKDLENSGKTGFYYLTQNALPVVGAYATLPDNVTDCYPDNIPDSWLNTEGEEIDPVPRFKLCRVAFGRLWIANVHGNPGVIRPSAPGKWGTFPKYQEIYPDPSGGEITGLWKAPRGLLAFSEKSTYLIEASDDGKSFKTMPLSSEIGCVAPSSIQTLDSGTVIWLGEGAFFIYDGQQVSRISNSIDKILRRVTTPRQRQACSAYDRRTREYRCWVSIDGAIENNMCFIFDGTGWRQRTDVSPRDVCVTKDHRSYMLAAGRTEGDLDGTYNGVFLLDHSGNLADSVFKAEIDARESTVETVWMEAQSSRKAKTVNVVYIWLRETENAEIEIEVMRDWREKVTQTVTAKRYSDKDVPAFWNSTKFSSGATWIERRPYWIRAEVYVPSAESFKFRLKGTGSWEFMGLSVSEAPRYAGGAKLSS